MYIIFDRVYANIVSYLSYILHTIQLYIYAAYAKIARIVSLNKP